MPARSKLSWIIFAFALAGVGVVVREKELTVLFGIIKVDDSSGREHKTENTSRSVSLKSILSAVMGAAMGGSFSNGHSSNGVDGRFLNGKLNIGGTTGNISSSKNSSKATISTTHVQPLQNTTSSPTVQPTTTTPFPLTASPTNPPTASPTNSPTASPTNSPTNLATTTPTATPTQGPIANSSTAPPTIAPQSTSMRQADNTTETDVKKLAFTTDKSADSRSSFKHSNKTSHIRKPLQPADNKAGFNITKNHTETELSPAKVDDNHPVHSNPAQIQASKWQEKIKDYQPWALCSGCYLREFPLKTKTANGTEAFKNTTCGELIYVELTKLKRERSNANITHKDLLVQVASSIAKEHEPYCARCDPRNCPSHEKIFRRYDDAAPLTLRAWSLPISKSLPEGTILPKEGVKDPLTFFSNPENRNKKGRYYHWAYNPSIVKIPNGAIPEGIVNNTEEVVYFSTQRVAVLNDAFNPTIIPSEMTGEMPPRWSDHEHIIFSFLREDLSVVQDCMFKLGGAADYRLFVLHDQLYLGMWNRIKALSIRKADHSDLKSTFSEDPQGGRRWEITRATLNPQECPFEIHRSTQQYCCADGCGGGKNFNYFTTKDGSVWVQTNPAEPLIVQKALIPCDARDDGVSSWVLPRNDTTNPVTTYTDDRKVGTSFPTTDEVHLPSAGLFKNTVQSGFRGSTCCVEMMNPLTKETVLVGINHRKQFGSRYGTNHRQYISNYYAIPTEPPFSIVAMSGSFCLGHPDEQGKEVEANHLAPLTRNKVFRMGDIMNCPQITFVSSMVENHANPENVLIGYGVNDLMSRVVEVSKANIMEMLFHPFSQNLTNSTLLL